MEKNKVSRRNLVKTAAFTGIAAGMTGKLFGAPGSATQYSSTTKNQKLGDQLIQPGQEGKEKHSPVIKAPAKAKAGEPVQVQVLVGEDKHHPNTSAHHIKWIQLYLKEEGSKPLVHVGTFDFGPGYAEPVVRLTLLLDGTSTLYATSYCNLHGLWESSVTVKV